ncbi:MAG TPA: adenosylmethionine--8-amino-7-oxononanoate transaminase [Polyangiaceae bacterium]
MNASHRERVLRADKQHLWHPYTAMDRYIDETHPLVVARAAGSRLYDLDGRSFIDGNASWWTALLGHNHPRLTAALCAQATELCHTSLGGITHEGAALFAEELVRVAPPGLSKVFFTDNGSTAVEAAIKLCVQYWAQNGAPERTRFVSLKGAFHGETLGVSALGGMSEFRAPFAPLLFPCAHLASPADGLEVALAELERELEQHGACTAAIVLEPLVQGASGMRIYPPVYLVRARELADAYGVLLVFDEVFTGYGRTGRMWAADHGAVVPDVLCSAKGLSGGLLPFAATLTTERIFEGFLGGDSRTFFYGHTFAGNPLGARVAREVLAIYRDEGILENVGAKARRLREGFAKLSELDQVENVRTLGMVAALDLVGGSGYLERSGWRVYEEALKRGAYVRPLGQVVYLTPPLNIPDADLDELLEIVRASVLAGASG